MRLLIPLLAMPLLFGCQDYNLKGQPKPEPPAEDPEDPPVEVLEQPDIVVSPLSLDFGVFPKGCSSDIREFKVSNVGEADLDVSDISFVGADMDAFRMAFANPQVIAPGESFLFSVDFTPNQATKYAVSLRVSSNDPDEPEVDADIWGSGGTDMTVEEAWDQKVYDKVDVLWVIDTSGSMGPEVNALSQVFDTFINQFINLGLDYQIGVTTTDTDPGGEQGYLRGPIISGAMADPVAEFTAQANVGAAGSNTERGFEGAQLALSPPLINNENAGLVRPDSVLSVIVVSNEDDQTENLTANQFANWINNYQGDPAMSSFSGVVGPANILNICATLSTGAIATGAPRYHKAITKTGGVYADICKLDFTTVLSMLSAAASGLQTEFPLMYPAVDITIQVEVNGSSVPHGAVNGWVYNAATNAVSLVGNAVPPPGAHVNISYETATACTR